MNATFITVTISACASGTFKLHLRLLKFINGVDLIQTFLVGTTKIKNVILDIANAERKDLTYLGTVKWQRNFDFFLSLSKIACNVARPYCITPDNLQSVSNFLFTRRCSAWEILMTHHLPIDTILSAWSALICRKTW